VLTARVEALSQQQQACSAGRLDRELEQLAGVGSLHAGQRRSEAQAPLEAGPVLGGHCVGGRVEQMPTVIGEAECGDEDHRFAVGI
jgi:hypothetical protein